MSSYVDYSIKTKEGFKQWILRKLGEPLITVELTDPQLEDCINDSVELFTKYCVQETKYFALPIVDYKNPAMSGDVIIYNEDGSGGSESGYKLPDHATGVFEIHNNTYAGMNGGINTMFSMQNTMLNAGVGFPGVNGNMSGGGWLSYHMAMDFLELTKKMTASEFDFEFNPRNKELTLIPAPNKGTGGHAVIGCHMIREDAMQYGEDWVKKYSLALAKILLGTIRKKFEGVQLLGGGQIDTSIGDEGITERDRLEENLKKDEGGVFGFFMG